MDDKAFQEGDYVLVADSKDRTKIHRLEAGKKIESHAGIAEMDAIIGLYPGSILVTSKGQKLHVSKPTMEEHILNMKRGAQIIYPKDFGVNVSMGDIFPGAKGLESGVGSGSLSLALLQAVGESGSITGFEIREDFAEVARKNIDDFSPYAKNYEIVINDIYEKIEIQGAKYDRIVLDLPEPQRVLPHLKGALVNGGIITSYVPTVLQAHKFCIELDDAGHDQRQTKEIMERGWYFSKTSARPDHRMVAHTGFITSAKIFY